MKLFNQARIRHEQRMFTKAPNNGATKFYLLTCLPVYKENYKHTTSISEEVQRVSVPCKLVHCFHPA